MGKVEYTRGHCKVEVGVSASVPLNIKPEVQVQLCIVSASVPLSIKAEVPSAELCIGKL